VIYAIDGTQVMTLEDFWRVIGEAVNGPGGYFGSNLDALADSLSGGPGYPDDGDFIIEWRDHELSRRALGYPETVRQLELLLAKCHPGNRAKVSQDIAAARLGSGSTVFDWIVGIFEARAPGVLQLR
jgi:RNAse (barnase) inhibitor barstar